MTVTDAIINITDRALFERIAVSILREMKPKYINIIHGGVNEKGETITSPLDAFHKINDSEFVLIEVTTDDTDIKKKWLDDKEGDLIKASLKADEWKKSYPNAKYTVWLCTNLRIKDNRSKPVFSQTIKEAENRGLNVEFLEQSAIVDYLENNSTGQWLAEKYLGITARRLSKEKLLSLCDMNNKEYQREVYFDSSKVVNRSKKKEFFEQITNSSDMNFLLLGESGVGKSTLLVQLLKEFLDNNQIAIRLKPQIVENAISITDAIQKQLKEYQPNIIVEEDVLIAIGKKILIVIDDVNRTNNPNQLIEKILTWQKQNQFIVICPVWNSVYNQIPNRLNPKIERSEDSNKKYFTLLNLDIFTDIEALTYLNLTLPKRNIYLSKQQIETVVKELSYNPFLLNTYCELNDLNTENYFILTQNPLKIYLEEKIKEIEKDSSLFFYAINQCLMTLSENMLKYKNFNVSFVAHKHWFNNDDIKILKEIGKFKQIFEVDEKGNLLFKHDKIRDFLLVKQIELYLLSPDLDNNKNTIIEPYFAELIGKAIGNISDISEKGFVIDYLLSHLPLSVFESLKYVQINEKSDFIHQKLRAWLEEGIDSINEAEIESIKKSLATLDYSRIIEITKYFKEDHWILIANFKNGDIISGAKYLSSFGLGEDFEPSFGNEERDRLIEHFNLKFKERGINALKELLQKDFTYIQEKNALIILAGYTKSPVLFDYVYKMWLTEKEKLLTSTIWALTNCLKDDFKEVMYEVFDYWASLEGNYILSEGAKYFVPTGTNYSISRCRFKTIPNNYVDFLLELSHNEKYVNLVRSFIVINSPNAFDYVVSRLAIGKKNVFENLALWNFTGHWDHTEERGKQISLKSLEKLSEIWQDKGRYENERHQSFKLWYKSANKTHLPLLKSIDKNDEVIYQESLRRRMFLKDETALDGVEFLIDEDNRDNAQWFKFLTFIWSSRVMLFFDNQINKYKHKIVGDFSDTNSWILGEIASSLKYIPNDDIDILLDKHWDKLGFDPDFLQLAVFIGTPKCKLLSSESFKTCPNPDKIFKYFGIRLFHGLINDNYHFERRKIGLHNLESIKPYFRYLRQRDIMELAGIACKQKKFTWVRDNLCPYIKKNSKEGMWEIEDLLPSDENLESEFMNYVRHDSKRWHLSDWTTKVLEKDCDKQRFMGVLQNCLQKYDIDKNMIESVATCIEIIGHRSDIGLIEYYSNNLDFANTINNSRYRLYRRTLI